MKLRDCAQIKIVGIEALDRLAGRPLDFQLAKLGLDCADDADGNLIL